MKEPDISYQSESFKKNLTRSFQLKIIEILREGNYISGGLTYLGMRSFLVELVDDWEEKIKDEIGNNEYKIKGQIGDFCIINSMDPLPKKEKFNNI